MAREISDAYFMSPKSKLKKVKTRIQYLLYVMTM